MGGHCDPRKWNVIGWKSEPRYSPGVLTGNWTEERYNFEKQDLPPHNSTYRTDYVPFGFHETQKPDIILRRRKEYQNMGLPQELIFHHHGNQYSNNMVTGYDENYNGRWREKGMPKLRAWNSHLLAWVPEKNDDPVTKPPTNWGLLGRLQKDWVIQEANANLGDYLSTYTVSYQDFPPGRRPTSRFGVPRFKSTKLMPVNKTLHNLHLRNKPMFRAPENLPCGTPNVCTMPSICV